MRHVAVSERGQGSLEYVALISLVAVVVSVAALAAGALPGAAVARQLGAKLLCAVRGSERCAPPSNDLQRAYGSELAGLLRAHAPEVRFEDGDFVSLPVDFRECRRRSCSDSSERGTLGRSFADSPATAFVRVIDCRRPEPPADGADCSGERAGKIYLQYWLYYPDSATKPWGRRGYHLDDWEDIYSESSQSPLSHRPDHVPYPARASQHSGWRSSIKSSRTWSPFSRVSRPLTRRRPLVSAPEWTASRPSYSR